MSHGLTTTGKLELPPIGQRVVKLFEHIAQDAGSPLKRNTWTPLGGRFNSLWLCHLWALLGIRNEHQHGLPAREVALRNVQYAKTGINYPTAREWELRSASEFADVGWGESAYVTAARSISRLSRFAAPALGLPGAEWIYRALHTRVLVLGRPR